MRTYSFDHFKADKPEPSTTNPGGAEQTPPAEQAKPQSREGQLHYGRQHARTAELYRKHREERERAERMRVAEAPQEPLGGEAPPAEVMEQEAAPVEHAPALEPDEAGREDMRGLAQQAVSSVVAAAKKAAKEGPLSGARKLAGDAFSGVRRVAREVSARTSRSTQDKQGGGKKKGPGKKR